MKELKQCLVCGSNDLIVSYDMGKMPLVNNLKKSSQDKEHIFPLLVNECMVCTHRQLSIAVEPELLFSDYLYQTGVSVSHRNFLREFAHNLQGESVLDIGCNDGTFISFFSPVWWSAVGIEPSKKLYKQCKTFGLQVINDYFPTKEKIVQRFNHITAFNVFAHNDNPFNFLMEMTRLLTAHGKIHIITTPSRIDNFYHEHISYFNVKSMSVLANRCGLEMVSFKEVSMHGKSYLFELVKKEEEKVPTSFIFTKPVVAYGASASETVLFNYLNITPEYVVDDNHLKQDMFIPGINSPIVSKQVLLDDKRDLTIIVAHHLFNEISKKVKELRPNNKDEIVRLI